MAQVKHPKFEGMVREVDDVEPWLEAGWVASADPSADGDGSVTPDPASLGAPSV